MDVATLAALGGVEDDEHVVGVGVHLGDVVARDAVPYGERMEAEDPRQHADGLLVAGGDVYPDESILALQQRLELLDGTLLNALIGYQANVHPARHLPD